MRTTTYEIYAEPHTCALPDPADYEPGVEIRCAEMRWKHGVWSKCNTVWQRGLSKGRKKKPEWHDTTWEATW